MHAHVHDCVYMLICMCKHAYIRHMSASVVCVCVCVCVCVRVCIGVYMPIYLFEHAYIIVFNTYVNVCAVH